MICHTDRALSKYLKLQHSIWRECLVEPQTVRTLPLNIFLPAPKWPRTYNHHSRVTLPRKCWYTVGRVSHYMEVYQCLWLLIYSFSRMCASVTEMKCTPYRFVMRCRPDHLYFHERKTHCTAQQLFQTAVTCKRTCFSQKMLICHLETVTVAHQF